MKYTDRFFEFPVRVYDRYTAEKAMKREDDMETPMEGDWIEGLVRINFKEITVWSDYFDSTQGVDGVKKEGWDATIIWTKNEGVFISTLKKSQFEKLLNEHSEKMQAYYDEEDKQLADKISKETGGAKTFFVR